MLFLQIISIYLYCDDPLFFNKDRNHSLGESKLRTQAIWYILGFLIVFMIPFQFIGCTSYGPTKPNLTFTDSPYPLELAELAQKNPLLVQELGKLPDLQDGVSKSDLSALIKIVEIYNSNEDKFNSAFNEMYKIGKYEFRKYCSPLEALFWIAKDDELKNNIEIISAYSLKKILDKAWEIKNPLAYRLLSDKQINEIIDGIVDEGIRNIYLDDFQKGIPYSRLQHSLVADYKRSKRTRSQVFSKKSAKIIKQNLLNPKSKDTHRWNDFNTVADRLNAPELLDYYINRNIHYDFRIPSFHRHPQTVIKTGYGDCDDLAYFGRVVLSKAGYDVFGRIVGDERVYCHIGLAIRLEDGSYILAVNFNQFGNHMSGPHKTVLELDQSLGYGPYRFNQRAPFHFDWNERF
jgi:hypothetical protein